MIVLEGLKGQPVAELCNAHQISQAQYSQRRDQFFTNAARAFKGPTLDQRLTHLQRENTIPKTLIGDLTVELKKTTRCGDEAGILPPNLVEHKEVLRMAYEEIIQ